MMVNVELIKRMKPGKLYRIEYLIGNKKMAVDGQLDSLHPEDADLILLVPRVIDYDSIISIEKAPKRIKSA